MKGGTSTGVNKRRKWVRKMKNSLNHLYYTGCPTTPTPVPAPPLPLAGMRQQTLPSQHMPSVLTTRMAIWGSGTSTQPPSSYLQCTGIQTLQRGGTSLQH